VIEIGVGEKNAGDRTVARRRRMWLQDGRRFDLPGQIGGNIDQEPLSIIDSDRDARLRLR
jgi:hypothetical protein